MCAETMAGRVCVALLTLISLIVYGLAFNLEPRIPVIKKGPPNSHFGYSVALHKALIPGTPVTLKNRFKSWLLVGAPKGQNLQPGTNRSGALYKCPLTTRRNDCEQVLTDGTKDPRTGRYLFKKRINGEISPPTNTEIKDDQWLGVTVKSQGEGGFILVCAHRYQLKGEEENSNRMGFGLCYQLTSNFEHESHFEPCVGKPVQREHHEFGYCQAGTSGVIVKDEVVLGVPGTYNWRGTVFNTNISSDFLYRDKTQYFGVYTAEESPVNKYSYLGYSVAVGKFFGDKTSYVAGAPRSKDTGQVIFFSKEKMSRSIMPYDLILDGEEIASSFGFEVVVMDINGDGLDDLVVSAPFYFTSKVSGAVYIYLNDGNGISNDTPFTRVEGKPGESRFGFSMTSLGDLNHDGYNDLAVGAPYDGNGAIYIYLGSKDGIIKEPAQVIRAEDLPGISYDAFGYALSGGMDIDNNGYNDLLTSSFCSDRVVLLRARPIINLHTKVQPLENLKDIDPSVAGCAQNRNSPETCFSFEACFKMEQEAGNSTFLRLQYTIVERMYGDQTTPRIQFHKFNQKVNAIENTIQLNPVDRERFQCSQELVYLKSDNKDVLRPLRFKLSYKVLQENPQPVPEGAEMPDIDLYPILNQQEAVRHFDATFKKDCETNVCQSDLILESDIDLPLKSPDEDVYVLELGLRETFGLTVNVSNTGEPAYQSNLYVTHDKAIDISRRQTDTDPYECTSVRNDLIHCELNNPLLNTTGPLRLAFKPSGFDFKSRSMDLILWTNSTSRELNKADNSISYNIEVKRRAEISITPSAEPEQVFYSGDVVGESAVKTMDEIGTEVIHKYVVDNDGPSNVDKLQVKILWPYQVENNKKDGKWLLYMTAIPSVVGDGECDMEPKYFNPINLQRIYDIAEDEVESDSYFEVTPSTVISSTKTVSTFVDKKVTIKETSSVSETKSSQSSYESRGGSRDNVRVARKVPFKSDKKQDIPEVNTSDNYDDRDYSAYNSFFANKTDSIYEEDDSDFVSEYERIDAIKHFKRMFDKSESYLIGLNKDGRGVWSSKDEYHSPNIENSQGSRRVHTEHSYKTYTSTGGEDPGRETSSKKVTTTYSKYGNNGDLKKAVQYKIQRSGNKIWVIGIDIRGKTVWSSRTAFQVGGVTDPISPGGDSYHREYSYVRKYSTSEGETGEEKFSSSDGTKWNRSWSSNDPDPISWDGNTVDLDNDLSLHERLDFDHPSNRGQGGLWTTGGYRRNSKSHEGEHTSAYNDDANDEAVYSRAVIDEDRGDAKVYTQKIYSKKEGNQWEEVKRGPFDDSEWTEENTPLKRSKREQEVIIKAEARTDPQSGKIQQVVNFRCDSDPPTAKCFTITCTIHNLVANQSSTIRIPSRLWNSTLIEDYPRVTYVSIRSYAELILPEEIRIDQDTSDDTASAETLAYSNLLDQIPPEEVPLWVILVSVLAGLLLLVLIAIVLWKLGFFKRRRPDPTLQGNLKGR